MVGEGLKNNDGFSEPKVKLDFKDLTRCQLGKLPGMV